MILCARCTSRSREQNTKRRSRSEIVYSIVKISRFYDYQTWPTHLFEIFTRCAKVCGLFFLNVLFECWLAGQTNSNHVVDIVSKIWKHAHPGSFWTEAEALGFWCCELQSAKLQSSGSPLSHTNKQTNKQTNRKGGKLKMGTEVMIDR